MKVLLSILLLALVSCVNKVPVSDNQLNSPSRNVSQIPDGYKSKLRVGDTISLKFNKDVLIGIGEKRIIYTDINEKDGGSSNGSQLSTIINSVYFDRKSQEYRPTSGERDYSKLEFTAIIDLKKDSDRVRYIKKGRVIVFKLVKDNYLVKGETEGHLNNLIAPEGSVISRVILNGGAGGDSIKDTEELKVSIGNFFSIVNYSPVDTKTVPLEVE